jgi:endogenous inhibitor of DNA gyrase (YacG/DUF329 family)
MDNKNDCPICGMKYNEPSILSPFAPSLCWLETTLKVNGVIQMKFGYGDDFDRIIYYPKYCPECGRKVKWDG